MPGPSLSGPLNGWTASTLAPKLTNLPVSQAAAARYVTPPGWSALPSMTPADQEGTKALHAEKLAKWKPEADALEKAGDQKSLEKALDLRKKIAVLESYGTDQRPLDVYKATVNNFKTTHPEYQLTQQEQHGLSLNFSGSSAPSLAESALGIPTAAASGSPNLGLAQSAGSSGNLSQYDLTASDYGVGGPDPRAAKPKGTPLESLLASIYPDLAAGPAADPLADPRATTSNSTFQNVLAGLGQRGSANGFVPGGPSLSGPAMVGPSVGANLAATIPGAPPFLAGAINGVQGFNPYAQRPMAPVAAGGGFDPLIGLSAISAEQRVQAAQLAKDKAAAHAKWFKSQADQEQMRADQANMSRLKGFSNSGWTGPALPTY